MREVTPPDFTRPDFVGASGLPPYSKPRTFWQRWRRKYLGGKALATYGAVLAVAASGLALAALAVAPDAHTSTSSSDPAVLSSGPDTDNLDNQVAW